MRLLSLLIFGISLLLLIPDDLAAQSRLPVYDRPNRGYRPPSRSRLPGARRPITPSRRDIAYQQTGWEFGLGFGGAYSLTDASGTSINRRASFLNTQWSTIDINAGGFGRYRFHELFAINTSFNYARIHGDDAIAGRKRGFSFSNTIYELAVKYEMFVPSISPGFPLDIYGFLGMAAFYHNPQLTVPSNPPGDFTWDEYSNFQPAIPLGFGVNYSVSHSIRIGYELGWRKTFFDHLDGFTRPASRGSDSYYFNAFTVSYFLSPHSPRW